MVIRHKRLWKCCKAPWFSTGAATCGNYIFLHLTTLSDIRNHHPIMRCGTSCWVIHIQSSDRVSQIAYFHIRTSAHEHNYNMYVFHVTVASVPWQERPDMMAAIFWWFVVAYPLFEANMQHFRDLLLKLIFNIKGIEALCDLHVFCLGISIRWI